MELTQTQIEAIVELYIAYFDRAPEFDGLEFHKAAVQADLDAGLTFEQAYDRRADNFFEAALDLPATGYSLEQSAADFIQTVYANTLLRPGEGGNAPSFAEISYWVEQLESGAVTRGSMITQFIEDTKFLVENGTPAEQAVATNTVAVLDNRVEVGLYFSQEEISGGLFGEEAYNAGVAALEGVNADPASVQAAIDRLDGVMTYTLEEALAAEELSDVYVISDASVDVGAGTIEETEARIAAANTIVAGARNAADLELDATYTIEDSAANVLAAAEAGNELVADVSLVTITDEAITSAQRDQLVELGFDPETLPTLDDEGLLTEALEAYQGAVMAESDALAEVALADNANEDDAEPVLEGAALDAFVAAYTGAQADAELAGANSRVFTAESTLATEQALLATARAGQSDAAVQTEYQNALTAVQQDATANGLLNARTQAEGAVAADVAADGNNVQLLTNVRAAILTYVEAGGDLSEDIEVGAGVRSVGDLLTDINTVLNADPVVPAAADVVVDSFWDAATDLATVEFNAPSGAAELALADALDTVVERAELRDNVVEAQTDLQGNGLGGTLIAEEADLAARQQLIENVSDAQADLADAQAYAAEIAALVEAYQDAQDVSADAVEAIEALGFEAPIDVDGAVVATTDADVFVFSGETGSVTNFGASGSDVLFVGEGYTLVDLATGANLGTTNQGSASQLEIFVQQDGGNTVLWFEDNAFDGSTTNGFVGESITLVGVDADQIELGVTGLITINSNADMIV